MIIPLGPVSTQPAGPFMRRWGYPRRQRLTACRASLAVMSGLAASTARRARARRVPRQWRVEFVSK